MDLSYNIISKIEYCQYCYQLSRLNLSFNRISSLEDIHFWLGNIRTLILRNNQISSTEGIQRLIAIEELDLSHNQIVQAKEIVRLQNLPLLRV